MKKLILVLELPPDASEEFLTDQLQFVVSQSRMALEEYKAKGLKVPILSLRNAANPKKSEIAEEYKKFSQTLLNHHLQFQPKADVAQQRAAIKKLYETGKTEEELIALYDVSRKEYTLTSWFTVAGRIAKPRPSDVVSTETFVRTELDETQREDLKTRLKLNSNE